MVSANRLGLASKSKLQSDRLEICQRALELTKATFAPVSGFAVGVVIRTTDGREFTGQNQENSAFDSIHAEMAALVGWNAAGEPKIETIAVAGFKFWPTQEKSGVVTPCGRCRQWLYEAIIRSGSDPEIICANGDLSSNRFESTSFYPTHLQSLMPPISIQIGMEKCGSAFSILS